MKAKVKETGILIDVHQYGDNDLWKCDELNMIFHKSALIFMGDIIDWEQRRYEISKDMLAALVSNVEEPSYNGDGRMLASCAVRFADELIDQLKNNNESNKDLST